MHYHGGDHTACTQEHPMLTVIVKAPGEDPTVQQIDGSVESIQKLVGGYFEAHRSLGGLTLFCNEGGFGQNKYMAPNVMDLCHADVLVGTVVVMDGDNGLKDFHIEPTLRWLQTRSVAASPA